MCDVANIQKQAIMSIIQDNKYIGEEKVSKDLVENYLIAVNNIKHTLKNIDEELKELEGVKRESEEKERIKSDIEDIEREIEDSKERIEVDLENLRSKGVSIKNKYQTKMLFNSTEIKKLISGSGCFHETLLTSLFSFIGSLVEKMFVENI